MTDIVVPAWALLIVGTIFLPWLIWLTLRVNSNDKDIALNTANDHHVGNELTKIYNAIEKQNIEAKSSFDRLENKFDTLMIQENKMFRELFSNLKT